MYVNDNNDWTVVCRGQCLPSRADLVSDITTIDQGTRPFWWKPTDTGYPMGTYVIDYVGDIKAFACPAGDSRDEAMNNILNNYSTWKSGNLSHGTSPYNNPTQLGIPTEGKLTLHSGIIPVAHDIFSYMNYPNNYLRRTNHKQTLTWNVGYSDGSVTKKPMNRSFLINGSFYEAPSYAYHVAGYQYPDLNWR